MRRAARYLISEDPKIVARLAARLNAKNIDILVVPTTGAFPTVPAGAAVFAVISTPKYHMLLAWIKQLRDAGHEVSVFKLDTLGSIAAPYEQESTAFGSDAELLKLLREPRPRAILFFGVVGLVLLGGVLIVALVSQLSLRPKSNEQTLYPAVETADGQDGPRLALLIGNETYGMPGLVELEYPHQDVERVAEALQVAGFHQENIRVLKDLNRTETILAVSDFSERLSAAGGDAIGFLYYSGHGASAERDSKRDNYIVPVREGIEFADDLEAFGVSLTDQIDKLEDSGAEMVFVVVDACRNTLSWRGTRAGAAAKGLRRLDINPTGMMLLFAAGEGEFADDDPVFSTILSEEIRRSGQDALKAFSRVSQRVGELKSADGRSPPILIPQVTKYDVCFVSCAPSGASLAVNAGDESE